jgi:AcrR family transcriptional regulator
MTEDGDSVMDDPFPDNMEPPALLMEATVRVLAEEGVDGLTLRKVAEKAGKNRGLVHYYFDSKADLLASLLDHILTGTQKLIGIDESEPPIENLWVALRFHAYGPGGLDQAGRHYYLAILQLQALAAHNEDIRQQFTRNHRYMVDVVATLIQEGIADGTFHQVDPKETASFLLASIDGARNIDLALNRDTTRDTTLRALEEYISEILIE